jgi:hypothetical protein
MGLSGFCDDPRPDRRRLSDGLKESLELHPIKKWESTVSYRADADKFLRRSIPQAQQSDTINQY